LSPFTGTAEDPESVNITYKTILLESEDTVEVAENVEVNWEDLNVGLRVGLRNVRESGRMLLFVPSVLAYGEQGQGDIPGDAILIYDITLNSFEHPQLKNEVSYIQAYLNDNSITAVKHPSGVFYRINELGEGAFPTWSSGVLVDYEGKLIESGEVFDQGLGRSFVLSELIDGWQIGLQQVREGGSVSLYIPSTFGYGPEGAGTSIPANASLEFDISLISVQN
jgi:FKBP-type peptidyl-prolyl cis-trans isomerase